MNEVKVILEILEAHVQASIGLDLTMIDSVDKAYQVFGHEVECILRKYDLLS